MDTKNFSLTFAIIGGIFGCTFSTVAIYLFLKNNPVISLLSHGNNFLFISYIIATIIAGSALSNMIGAWFYKRQPVTIPFPPEKSQTNTVPDSTPESTAPNSCIKTKEALAEANNETVAEKTVDTAPVTPTEALNHAERTEIKKEFEEKVSSGTFEDPNVVIEHPGEMLVETPATLFNKEPMKEPEKPELPDESFPRKELKFAVPRPPGSAPPAPKPAK